MKISKQILLAILLTLFYIEAHAERHCMLPILEEEARLRNLSFVIDQNVINEFKCANVKSYPFSNIKIYKDGPWRILHSMNKPHNLHLLQAQSNVVLLKNDPKIEELNNVNEYRTWAFWESSILTFANLLLSQCPINWSPNQHDYNIDDIENVKLSVVSTNMHKIGNTCLEFAYILGLNNYSIYKRDGFYAIKRSNKKLQPTSYLGG